MPQALTWNIGTIGSSTSRSPTAIVVTPPSMSVCRKIARWE